ncbi:hypothetical protein AA313_de0207736 [Arthrobotrys entomopaga]|nr:hypothetical protein AA313_de0207736 [Arthrobotrys entomopaga]
MKKLRPCILTLSPATYSDNIIDDGSKCLLESLTCENSVASTLSLVKCWTNSSCDFVSGTRNVPSPESDCWNLTTKGGVWFFTADITVSMWFLYPLFLSSEDTSMSRTFVFGVGSGDTARSRLERSL